MELSISGLRVVQEVAARGSFTAAADALGYTQSAVSRQVSTLEQAVGAPLFERHARGVRPTGAGTILLRHAAAVLDRLATAELELAGQRDRLEGRLVVGAFATSLGALVPRALARLREQHAGIAVTLREGPTPTQLRRLRAERIEVAVIAVGAGLEYSLEGLRADVVLQGGLLVAVASEHRFAQRGWTTVGELEAEDWIVGDPGDGGPQFGPWPTLDGTPRVQHSVRDWTARLGLVAAGLGISVIPEIMAASLPAGVQAVAVDDPRPQRRSLLAVTGEERSPTAAALVEALHDEASALGLTSTFSARPP
jgi:DNA-binding transcriptional LysR family regulator